MPTSETSLAELLHEVRRIEEHRTILTDKKIEKIYQQLMKELNAFLSDYYIKYADDEGKLTGAMLEAQGQKAKFLEECVKNVDSISLLVKKEITKLVEETYAACYSGMAKAVKKAKTTEEIAEYTKGMSVRPEVMKRAVNNNISKLTLPPILEKNRQEVIYDIQQTLNVGLVNGDRYETMSKRISERLNVSRTKANNIVRTESHRNVESGFMDSAKNIQESFDGSDLVYTATWRTMKDERVRPQQRRKSGGKWKTTLSKNGANHIKMEGVTVKVGDKFKLETGVTTESPSNSGYARHDCNCRCFLEYDLMTIEEFEKATGKPVNVASLHKSVRQAMNENGIADCGLERTTDSERFASAIDNAKKANKNGGSVDTHPTEELRTFKTFVAKNDMAGVAVKADGDITAVFKNSNYKQRGVVNDLIITARENGGTKMDCYGQFLANAYEQCGYVPVARVPFNADYVSDPLLLKTKPDVYVLMKNTDSIDTVIKKNGAKAYKLSSQEQLDKLPTFEYDDALNYRDKLLRLQENK